MKEATKKKKKDPISHTNKFCLNSTTLLTNGWKRIRINVFRICNYNQKDKPKKKKMTQYFKQGDVSNVWHELTN